MTSMATRPPQCAAPAGDEAGLDIEQIARAILREKIRRLPWHPGVKAIRRRELIERDVDRFWRLCRDEAADRLMKRIAARQSGLCPTDCPSPPPIEAELRTVQSDRR